MAQHLRIGSVVDVGGGTVQGPYTYPGAVVTNVTDAYLEFEWTDPATSITHVGIRSWSATSYIRVVTD